MVPAERPTPVKLMTKPLESSGPAMAGGATNAAAASANLRQQRFKFLDGRLQICSDSVAVMEKLMLDSPAATGCPAGYGVVGVLGCQGTGKSTILSHLAGQTSGAGRSAGGGGQQHYGGSGGPESGFQIGSGRCLLEATHCTEGVDLLLNPSERLIVLDSQPVLSASVLMAKLKDGSGGKGSGGGSSGGRTLGLAADGAVELESLMLMVWMLAVCNVVLVTVDTVGAGTDSHFLRLLTLAADILQPPAPPPSGADSPTRDGGDGQPDPSQAGEAHWGLSPHTSALPGHRDLAEIVVVVNKCPIDQLYDLVDPAIAAHNDRASSTEAASQTAQQVGNYLGALLPSALLSPAADGELARKPRMVRLPWSSGSEPAPLHASPSAATLLPPPPPLPSSTNLPAGGTAVEAPMSGVLPVAPAGQWAGGQPRSFGASISQLVGLVLPLMTAKPPAASARPSSNGQSNGNEAKSAGSSSAGSSSIGANSGQAFTDDADHGRAGGPPGLAGPFVRPLLESVKPSPDPTTANGASGAARRHGATERDWSVRIARHCSDSRVPWPDLCALLGRLAAATTLWRKLQGELESVAATKAAAPALKGKGKGNKQAAPAPIIAADGAATMLLPPADAAERLGVYHRVLMGGGGW